MQIDCPSCGAAYEVPDHILARKRMMRCARCARDWAPVQAPEPVQEAFAPPLSAAPVPVAAPVQAPAAARREPGVVAPLRVSTGRKAAIVGAWTASLAVLALAGWWSIASEKRIVQMWPASARLYAALGVGG